MSEPEVTPVWLVTGASAGFGRAIAAEALGRGHRVVVTARDPAALADLTAAHPDRAHALALDVTDPARIPAVAEQAVARFGRIDVLVNNAGRGMVGALEEVSEQELRDLLEVNLVGALLMARAVIGPMRTQRSGVLVQLSSVGGIRALPGHALYAASKFALEGASEAMAAELAPFGIRVLVVEPGPFRTDFAGRSLGLSTPLDAYADTPAGATRRRLREQSGRQPNDPVRAAAVIVDAALDPDAPLRLPLGPEAFAGIRHKLTAQLADLERVEAVASDTGFRD